MQKLYVPCVPHLVHIETTYACNKRCTFCYNPLRGLPFSKPMVDKIVGSIFESWVPHVYLIGGEPSLLGVKQLNEYIDLLSTRSSVTIVTNGLVTLDGLSNRLACIGVPIHGDEETHNRHAVGYGGYKETIRSIQHYVKSGFDVRCIPVLTAWNYSQIYRIAKTAKNLGMESVFVDRFEDGGLGSANADQLKPTIGQFKIALSQMIEARDKLGIAIGFGTAIPYCLDERLVSENISANCGVGTTFAAIDPEGNVRICNQSQIIYGNVLSERIEKIWQSERVSDFRDLSWVQDPCIFCPVLHDCLCGCKVDCSCSSGYCVDYSVRGLKRRPFEADKLPARGQLKNVYPASYRHFCVDRFVKLNEFHAEKYMVTRYQTIELDDLALEILKRIMSLGIFGEADLTQEFSENAEEADIRKFLSNLEGVGAIRESRGGG